MHRTWVGVALIAAGLAAGCGQGRVIFNVDVYSWLSGSGKNTVTYGAPPATTDSASTFQKISLPGGLGSSLVDTVKVTGSMDFRNQSGGPATISFQVYLARDSAGTYQASRDSILTPPLSATLSGSNTTLGVPINANNLSPKGDSLFTGTAVWVRVTARAVNSGTLLVGNAILTALQLRVVVQDKVF